MVTANSYHQQLVVRPRVRCVTFQAFIVCCPQISIFSHLDLQLCCTYQRCAFPCDEEVPCVCALCGLKCYGGDALKQYEEKQKLAQAPENQTMDRAAPLIGNQPSVV
jgi:hypothetical protein